MAFVPTFSITISRRVNLGNYESAEVYMSAKDISVEMTEFEIRELIEETGGRVFNIVMEEIDKKIKALRA
jgi:hypothetical protein